MFENLDDSALVSACKAGQTEAYGVLVRKYQDKLYPTLLRLTGHPEDAHDLLQDSFLRAFEKLGKFHGESSFFTWIYRIAINLSLSNRRRRRPLTLSRESSQDLNSDGGADPRNHDPSLPLEAMEREQLVQNALNALAKDQRAVVVLKEFDGLQYDEIAGILKIPVGTVRSRLHRARLELKERLRSLVEGDDLSSPIAIAGENSVFQR